MRRDGVARRIARHRPPRSRTEHLAMKEATMSERADDGTLIIDCDSCAVRPTACADCVVSVLLGPPGRVEWDADERRAVTALADAGMVPRLRLVPRTDRASKASERRAG